MEQNIQKQLNIIKESHEWINSSLDGEKQKNAYRSLVNCRRKLNKKKFGSKQIETKCHTVIQERKILNISYDIGDRGFFREPYKAISL